MSNDSSRTVSAQKSAVPWHPLTAVLIVVLGFLVAEIGSAMLVSLYPHLRHWNAATAQDWLSNNVAAQFFFVLVTELVLVGCVYGFVRWRRGSLRALGVRRPRLIDIAYALLGAVAYFLLYIVALIAVGVFVQVNMNQKQDLGFNQVSGVMPLVLTFISLAVLAPLAEEFAFRGFLFTSFRKRMGLVVSMLLTSALFAVPHLMEADSGVLWVAGIDTFALSVVLCYLREKTGRLWAGVGIHMLKNTVAFLTLYIAHLH